MSIKLKIKIFYLVNSISCGFAALYLTCVIDQMTLTTNLQRLFVWCYFYVILFALIWFMKSTIIAFITQYKLLTIVCVFSLLGWCIIGGGKNVLPKKALENEIVISIEAGANDNSKGKEVWINSLSLDGETQPLEMLQNADQGWIIKENAVYGSFDMSNSLILSLPSAKEMELTFGMHPWSGIVDIRSNDFYTKHDLYDALGSACVIKIPESLVDYSGIFWLALLYGYFSLCIIIGQIVVFFLQKKGWLKGNRKITKNMLLSILLLASLFTIVNLNINFITEKVFLKNVILMYLVWLAFLYIVVSPRYSCKNEFFLMPGIIAFVIVNQHIIEFEFFVKVLICLISFAVCASMNDISTLKCMRKYFSGFTWCALVLLSFYATFACVGYSLFLTGTYMHGDIQSVALFLVFSIWMFGVILCVLMILEKIAQWNGIKRKEYLPDKWGCIKDRYIIMGVLFLIWEIILVSYFPGNFSPDSIAMWRQAVGLEEITTHHSALLIIIVRFLTNMIKSPFGVMTVQVFVAAWVISYIIVQLKNCFKHRYPIIIVTILFAIIPSNYKMITTFWKDIPFTLSLVALSGLLYDISKNPDKFWSRKINFFAMIFAIIGVSEFRHNGLFVVLITLMYLVYLTLKNRKTCFRYLSMLLAVVSIISIVHGPIYSIFNVTTSARTSKPYITMFAALGSAVNKQKDFSEETTELLFSIMEKDEWVEYYNPFNIDSYRWNPEIESNMDISWVNAKDAFTCYMEGLIKYPDIIIKDRLDGANIIWDVSQPKEAFNERYLKGVWVPNGVEPEVLGLQYTDEAQRTYQPSNLLTRWLDFLCDVASNKILDSLIYRSGIYLIFFFILAIFNLANRNKYFMVASIPLFWNTVALMLLTAHQSFRYVWYIPVCVFALSIFTFVDMAQKGGNEI